MELIEGKFGLISDIDAQTMRVKVLFQDGADDITTDWLPIMVMPGSFYTPAANDQVLAFMDQYLEAGVVLGGVYNTNPFNDADTMGFKFPGVELQINKKTGATVFKVSGSATIEASKFDLKGDLNLTGNLKVTGDASTTGKVTATGVIKSAADVRTANVSLNTHMHPSAAVGPPTPPTPVPQP